MINTLAVVKKHLRLSSLDTSEDDLILLYMGAAEGDIKNYIDGDIPGISDSPPSAPPFPIQAAQLLIIGGLYENRESETVGGTRNQIMDNPAVKRLLNPYRNLGV